MSVRIRIVSFIVLIQLSLAAAESPPIGAAKPVLGPIVDVTMKSGESKKGQLLSFADGNLALKLFDGTVVTREGDSVVSVRFILAETPAGATEKSAHLTSGETELTFSEFEKLRDFRMREFSLKGNGNGALLPKVPLAPLSESEKAEHRKLVAKAEVHFEVLKNEIPDVKTEEAARSKLIEMGRYGMLCGHTMFNLRATMESTAGKIKEETIRKNIVAANVLESISKSIVERKNGNKIYEKGVEKRVGPPTPGDHPPAPPEKPPVKTPPTGN